MNDTTVQVSWERQDGVTYAIIRGRVDTTNANDFQAALEAELRPDDTKLVLDFETLEFISSAGLRVIIAVAKQIKARQGAFALCSPMPSVMRVMTISGLEQVLGVYPSRAQALRSFT